MRHNPPIFQDEAQALSNLLRRHGYRIEPSGAAVHTNPEMPASTYNAAPPVPPQQESTYVPVPPPGVNPEEMINPDELCELPGLPPKSNPLYGAARKAFIVRRWGSEKAMRRFLAKIRKKSPIGHSKKRKAGRKLTGAAKAAFIRKHWGSVKAMKRHLAKIRR